MDRRDYKRRGTSSNPGVDRYGRLAKVRDNMLRQRGYTDVQNYGNDDSVLMTKAQVTRMDSIRNPVSKADYVNKVYQGLSNG